MADEGHSLLQTLWMGLLKTARIKGIPDDAAEDLVGDAILKAFEKFDPERGRFAPFSRKILENLIKNFWRGHRPNVPFEDIPEPPDPDNPYLLVEGKENVREVIRMARQIADKLDAEERKLFEALREVLREQDTRAVSEAARRIGLSAQKGWDLFRRIQRKSSPVVVEHALADMAQPCHSEVSMGDYSEGVGIPAIGGYERFSASLSRELKERIVNFLSPEDLF